MAGDEFINCRFCGCSTNAHLRACCELGRADDLGRVTPEQCARWEKEAEQWLVEPKESGRELEELFMGSLKPPETAGIGPLVRMLAGRVTLLVNEIGRLRRDREGVKALSQKASRVDEALRLFRVGDSLGRALGVGVKDPIVMAREVLEDDSWFYLDGVRYCARCGSRRCKRQAGGSVDCVKEDRGG